MGLKTVTTPETSITALRVALTTLTERGQLARRLGRPVGVERLHETKPHPVYVMDLGELLAAPNLASARLVGWRHLVELDDRVVAAGQTWQADDGTHSFSHVNYGPFVAGTVDALAVAEAHASGHDYELRLLEIPALYLVSLWLEPTGGSEPDYAATLIPVAPTPSGIEANRPQSPAEVLSLLAQRGRSAGGPP